MTIDQTYTVDTALASLDVDTLMTKAFELTHRIHALGEERSRAKGAMEYEQKHNARAEARAQRDAIVREMQRRSDAAERALVTVEVAERALRHIDATLGAAEVAGDDESLAAMRGRIALVREVADGAMRQASNATCSLVKNQALSDRISVAARAIVKPIKEAAQAAARTTR